MSIDVTFLGQAYSFGDDLKEYVDALRLSEKISDSLVNIFLSLSKRKGGIIDATDLKPDLIRKADEYIKKLCNRGIFSKSAEDYVNENDGYKAIQQICADGVSVYSKILIDEINEFQDGMNDAYSEAASNITGTGVRVYTSSLATLALNSAYEYSVLKGQAKKADAQYKKAIDELSDRTEARSDRRKNEYLKNTYYPRMTDALTLFAFGLVQRYISDLITEGKFDDSVLKNAEIKKSNTLLDNLKHITDHNSRLECIKQAFEACPFNEIVYDTAIDREAFDSDSFYSAKSFGIDEIIVGKLKNKISFSETADLEKKINNKIKYINAYSICTGINVSDVLKSSTASIYNSVIMGYRDVITSTASNNALYKLTYYLSDDELLNLQDTNIKERVIKAVTDIVSDQTFNTLINKCGYTSLFNELSDVCGNGTLYTNKTDLDNAFIDKTYNELRHTIEQKQTSINERRKIDAEKRQAETEAAAKRSRKNKKIAVAVISSVLTVSIISVLAVNVIIPEIKYNSAKELMNTGKYDEAIIEFENLNGYSDSNSLIDKCKNAILENKYAIANNKMDSGDLEGAKAVFTELGDFKDSKNKIKEIENEKKYQRALNYIEHEDYNEARAILLNLADYKDSSELYYNISEPYYSKGLDYYKNGDFDNAIIDFKIAESYKDSKNYLSHISGLIEIDKYSIDDSEELILNAENVLHCLKNIELIDNATSQELSKMYLTAFETMAKNSFEKEEYLRFSEVAFKLKQYGFISDELLSKYNDYVTRFDLNGTYKNDTNTKDYYYEVTVDLLKQQLTITYVSWIGSDIFKNNKEYEINWDNRYEEQIEGYTIVYELSASSGTLKQNIKENDSDFSATFIFKKQ